MPSGNPCEQCVMESSIRTKGRDMVAAAPPEKTSRLPTARTSLVGRTTERAAARGFLLEDAVPLLTLTGPGGVGKTRLALAIAHDLADAFVDGAVFVDLTP